MRSLELVTKDKAQKLNEVILIVDDEESVRNMLSELVSDLGFKAIGANGGREALEKLKDNPCFLILTDYSMPEMSGLDFAKLVREDYRSIPIVLLSGFGDKNLVTQAMKVGVSDFFDKPFPLDDIESFISKTAANRLKELELEAAEMESLSRTFVDEAQGVLVELEELVTKMADVAPTAAVLNSIFRKVHNLKGSAGVVGGASNLVDLAHVFETVLSHLKGGSVSMNGELQETMLASVDLLSSCVSAIAQRAEIPDTRHMQSRLTTSSSGKPEKDRSGPKTTAAKDEKAPVIEISDDGLVVSNLKLGALKTIAGDLMTFNNSFCDTLQKNRPLIETHVPSLLNMDVLLGKMTSALQAEIIDIQQVPLSHVFGRFPRIVRLVSGEVKKQIKLELVGQEMTVDRIVARELGDALIHAVRNSCDHGIELPDSRVSAGKDAEGTITIRGRLVGSMITIEVEDDGAGLNRDRILAKATEKQLVSSADAKKLSDRDVWEMLFLPNFSTAAQVSNLSGRGVGMDVVKTVALKFGGTAWFDTVLGQSTKLTMQFPVPHFGGAIKA
jgi:two-component system, chemotaxis family, sensor kinase CheA